MAPGFFNAASHSVYKLKSGSFFLFFDVFLSIPTNACCYRRASSVPRPWCSTSFAGSLPLSDPGNECPKFFNSSGDITKSYPLYLMLYKKGIFSISKNSTR